MTPLPMTLSQADRLAHQLLGTCKSPSDVLEDMGLGHIDEDEALDQVAADVEKCQGCEWWFEPCMLDSEEAIGEPGYCDDCRKDHGNWHDEDS